MVPAKTPISPKAIAGAIGALVPGVILAILLAVQNDPTTIANLPTWVQSLIVAVLPALVAYVAAYQKRDPLRDAGAGSMPVQPLGEGLDDTGSANVRLLLGVVVVASLMIAFPVLIVPFIIVATLAFLIAATLNYEHVRAVTR